MPRSTVSGRSLSVRICNGNGFDGFDLKLAARFSFREDGHARTVHSSGKIALRVMLAVPWWRKLPRP